jgi:hypothetical protein
MAQGDQLIRARPGLDCFRSRFFAKIGNPHIGQQTLNGVIQFAQRFLDGTGVEQIAVSVIRGAGCDEERAFDGANYLKRGDLAGWTAQSVAAMNAGVRNHQSRTSQSLQHFCEQWSWNVIGLGDIFGALGLALRQLRQVLEGDQTIVGFFRETEHEFEPTLPGPVVIRPAWL